MEEAKDTLLINDIILIKDTDNIKYNLNRNYFDNIDSREKAFWLGFICADGSIKSIRGNLYFKITQKDDYLLHKLKEDISYTGNINKNSKIQKGRYSSKEFYELTVYDKVFSESLIGAGKTRYKKDLKKIPESVPQEFVIDFIRGYFEGDGSISICKNNNWKISISGEIKLLEEFKELLVFGGIYKDKNIGSYSINGNKQVEKLINTIYYEGFNYGVKILKYKAGLL